ncbi:MAG: hypothetical protein ACOCRD_03065 [Halorubrum sp.]
MRSGRRRRLLRLGVRRTCSNRFVADDRASGGDDRLILVLLLLLSVVVLAVFLYYALSVLGGLPQVIPEWALRA